MCVCVVRERLAWCVCEGAAAACVDGEKERERERAQKRKMIARQEIRNLKNNHKGR